MRFCALPNNILYTCNMRYFLLLLVASVTHPLNSIIALSLIISLSGLRPSSTNNILRLFVFLRRFSRVQIFISLCLLVEVSGVTSFHSVAASSLGLTTSPAYSRLPLVLVKPLSQRFDSLFLLNKTRNGDTPRFLFCWWR